MPTNPLLLGQVGLIPRGDSFIAKGIQFVTRSPVYHCIVCVGPNSVVEAQPGGAILSPITKWPTVIWSHFPLTQAQAQASADWATMHIGTPYSFLDDAAIGVGLVLNHWVGFQVQKFLSSDKTLQCAQLADSALTKGAKIKVFEDDRPSGAVYPGSFVPLFKANGWWTE